MSPRAKYNNRSDSQAGHELFPSVVWATSEQTPHCWCAPGSAWHTHSYLRVSQHILGDARANLSLGENITSNRLQAESCKLG